jgi:hypothetical protein
MLRAISLVSFATVTILVHHTGHRDSATQRSGALPALRQHGLLLVGDLDRGRPLVRIHADTYTPDGLHPPHSSTMDIGEEGNATLTWA